MGAVTDYLATLPASDASALVHVMALALEEVPEAVEARSFGLPALRVDGRRLLGVAASGEALVLFPFSTDVVQGVSGRLTDFTWSASAIRFTADHPLPDDVVREVVRLRYDELTRESERVA